MAVAATATATATVGKCKTTEIETIPCVRCSIRGRRKTFGKLKNEMNMKIRKYENKNEFFNAYLNRSTSFQLTYFNV